MLSKHILSYLSLFRWLFVVGMVVVWLLFVACNGRVQAPPRTTIYAVSTTGTVYAVDGAKGATGWSYPLSGNNGSPWGASQGLVLVNHVIYTSSSVDGGYVYALQERNGAPLWYTPIHPQGLPSAPVVADGVVYLFATLGGASTSYVYALNSANGALLWSTSVKGQASSLEVVGTSLYLGTSLFSARGGPQPGFVFALRTRNGSLLWQRQLGNTIFRQVVLNGVVYSDDGAAIYALRADNGMILWQKSMRADALVARGNVLYASVNSTLYALRADNGTQLWQASTGRHVPYDLVVAGNALYAVSFFDAGIYALRTQDGASLWNYQARASSCGSLPVAANGVVYFSVLDGTIYELASADGSLIASYPVPNSRFFTCSPLAVEQ